MGCVIVKELSAYGYENYESKIKEIVNSNPDSKIFVVFVGDEKEDGKSWCPDCVKFEEVLKKVTHDIKTKLILLRVRVGVREIWKNPENPFRLDEKLQITSIPTLIKLEKCEISNRISEAQIVDQKVLFEFFN